MMADSPAEEGQAALRSGDWRRARECFEAALSSGPDGTAYEGLAQAQWWLDDGLACLQAREDAYRHFRATEDLIGAARAATALSYDTLLFGQSATVARGWWRRAEDLLEGVDVRAEHGWHAVRQAELAMAVEHDTQVARDAGERVETIGRTLGEADLRFAGMAISGLAIASSGDPALGMARLDSAVAAATAGDVRDLMWMGKICCWLIVACQETNDLARADEWCLRVEDMCRRQNLTPLFSVCQIQHSTVLIARGTWPEAERALVAALAATAGSQRRSRLEAVVQLGELRRRQGRLAEADGLLAQAEFSPAAITSRAMIRLQEGDPAAAWAAIRLLLPTIPDANRLARARVLLPAVLAAQAAGDHAAAEQAADELDATARAIRTGPLLGIAAVARATVGTDDGECVRRWREAVERFHDAGLAFDEAEGRLGLARALLRLGESAAADQQLTVATAALTELGAAASLLDADCLRTTIAGDRTSTGLLSEREVQVLRLVARGLTNQQIADDLVLSPHTVHRHIANILVKLDQGSRAGATAYALTHHLI